MTEGDDAPSTGSASAGGQAPQVGSSSAGASTTRIPTRNARGPRSSESSADTGREGGDATCRSEATTPGNPSACDPAPSPSGGETRNKADKGAFVRPFDDKPRDKEPSSSGGGAVEELIADALIPHLATRCDDCGGSGEARHSQATCRFCGGTGLSGRGSHALALDAARDVLAALPDSQALAGELADALKSVSRNHHHTLAPSKLHNPHSLSPWECGARTCRMAGAALARYHEAVARQGGEGREPR